ncbi:hypothetical protein V1389_14635 [Flavobacterium rakeshii]|uniref:hypothetical protein n=1 Tax=Flavobacterium rakeshii TaxID=1038845 RepID=UPI002E7B2E1F|nr:hypothetical protein [Flavobacterium rakeshii]MEE1899583.1 hypothetical protein [Flavobacterium rakeshii]
MFKKLEEVVELKIPAGSTSNSYSFQPQAGLVIGCVIFHNEAPNTGMVQASIKTDNGESVSAMSHIENYRSREAGYKEGCKPLYLETGNKNYVFEVSSDKAFDEEFRCQLVLIYENDFTKNC